MEEVGEVVVADAQLRGRGVGVAHGGQQAGLEAVILVARFANEVIALEEPLLRLAGDLLPVPIDAQLEGAVRDEIGHDELRGGGGGSGSRGSEGSWDNHDE